jgi:cyanophycinase
LLSLTPKNNLKINPNDISTSTTPGTVLMGGGTDVDAAFHWMCQRSGGGDFLVIRATGTDAYNPYIQTLCPNEIPSPL